jgi:uncharacterized membrane protein YgcG
MKKLFTLALLFSLTTMFVTAQDKTTVTANSSEISDNLDLRAIATIFGESSDLEDFEKRINDPKAQISNLDLNNDNYVDYLRVIESIEGNSHIIIVQSVIDKDLYQDVASIEVQKDRATNRVQVQVVGDVYMYGQNYIYEPVYVHTPIIYNTFWVNNYRPYYSSWYWGYYPSYYTYWSPFPVFRYRSHINIYIGGYGHSYNYVNYRNCSVAYNAYYGRRSHAYETRYPNRSFSHRNATVSNRHELDRNRDTRTVNTRERGNTQARIESSPRSTRDNASTRDENPRSTNSPRANTSTRDENPRTTTSNPRSNNSTRDENPRNVETTPRTYESPRSTNSKRNTTSTRSESPRSTTSSSRNTSSPKMNTSSRSSSSTRTSAPSRSSSPSVRSSKSSSPSSGSSRGSSSRGGSSRGGGRE